MEGNIYLGAPWKDRESFTIFQCSLGQSVRPVLERILPGANGYRTREDADPHNQITERLRV